MSSHVTSGGFVSASLLLAALALGGTRLAPATAGPAPRLDAVAVAQLQVQASTGQDLQASTALATQARAGNALAQRAWGLVLLKIGTQTEGLYWLHAAATQGDAAAQVALGKRYLHGSAQLPRDYAQALHWFGLAGQQQHPAAAYYLGVQYANGYGVPANPTQAFSWFAMAAQDGQPAALFMLANAYRLGHGVRADYAKALAALEAAAEQEHPQAIQTLALAYQHGEMGLRPNPTQAAHYMAETAHALKHPPLEP
jgi:TPR repeat protein